MTRRRAAPLLGLVLALASGTLAAHQASDAYLRWQVSGTVIDERVDIALRDLDRDLGLDTDEDGLLRWGEVRSRWAELERLRDESVRLTADGRACTPQPAAAPQLEEHGGGRYAVLQRRHQCAAPVQALQLDYRLFATSDPAHRGIARITGPEDGPTGGLAGGPDHSAVLVPGAGARDFVIDPALVRGAAPLAFASSASSASSAGFAGFLGEGMHHIAIGLDHVLFLVSLLMVAVWRRDGPGWTPRGTGASAWKEALRLVSAFTLAHSLTLGLAAAGVLAPPSRWVESLIAASVLVAALDNLRPFLPGPRWAVVSVFGLVHGFGFAGPLQDLGLRQGALALPLLGFNLGVELGQLLLVAALLPLACLARGHALYRWGVVRGGSALIATLAAAWTVERSLQVSLLP